MRICEDVLDQAVAPGGFGIGEPVEKAIAFRVLDQVLEVAFFLMAKGFSVADEELEIARVGFVNGGVVDFVDDAMAEREPDPAARMISGAETFFGAGGPAGFDSGRAECDRVFSGIHVRTSSGFASNLGSPRQQVLQIEV